MMKMEPGVKQYREWLKELPAGSKVGVDEAQIPLASFELTAKELHTKDIELVCAGGNLVDEVWGKDKTPAPREAVWHLEDKYTGQSTLDKYATLSGQITASDVDVLLVTTLDDIAWLLNLRGNDIDYNPLFFSYLLFHNEPGNFRCDLFIDPSKVESLAEYLASINVTVRPYDTIQEGLKQTAQKSFMIDPNTCNYMLYDTLA